MGVNVIGKEFLELTTNYLQMTEVLKKKLGYILSSWICLGLVWFGLVFIQ